jgi:Protein of unknown function (Gmx_para_CXXCG)
MFNDSDIFEMRRPYYKSDQASKRANPLAPVEIISLPGVICPYCKETWSGSRRLYLPIRSRVLRNKLSCKPPLPLEDWLKLADKVKLETGFSGRLQPGDVFEYPRYKQVGKISTSCIHAGVGRIILSNNLCMDWLKVGISGWYSAPAQIIDIENSILDKGGRYVELVACKNINQESNEFAAPLCKGCMRQSSFICNDRLLSTEILKEPTIFNINNNPNRVFLNKTAAVAIRGMNISNIELVKF